MTLTEIMAKLAKGEPITNEEYVELGKLTRPTERFNEVSGKKSELENSLKEAQNKIAELEAAVVAAKQTSDDELNTRLGELSGRNEELTTALTKAEADLKQANTLLKVGEISRKNDLGVVFKNPDYLAFRVAKEGIDLNDADKVKAFLTGIKDNEPEMCTVAVKGGAGTGGGDSTGGTQSTKPLNKWSDSEKSAYITENGYDAYVALLKNESE